MYKYNNVVIKPGLYLLNQGSDTSADGGSNPVYSSTQLSLDGTNDLARINDAFLVLPGYKAILYTNSDISYVTAGTIDNTLGNDIINSTGSVAVNTVSKIDLFYKNVKIDYTNIIKMGFKATATLVSGAELGQYSDGSYNKYALILESSTPRLNGAGVNENEVYGKLGINRPYLSLPWMQPIVAFNASHSFWWCSKGYQAGVGSADINYNLNTYNSSSGANATIIFIDNGSSYSQIFFQYSNPNNLVFYQLQTGSATAFNYTSSKNICDGLWHHIVWNINSTTWTIYTDGVAETATGKNAYNMGAITNVSSAIGKRTGSDITTNGYIADYRFYKNSLSTQDIAGLYTGDHTYQTALDVSSCLMHYTFKPDTIYTNNTINYVKGSATIPYQAQVMNGADIMMSSLDLTESIGKCLSIPPFTSETNGISISFWWKSNGLWAEQGPNSRLFYFGNGDASNNITFTTQNGSNGYPTISTSDNTSETSVNLTSLTNFCDDTWKHVVWTINPNILLVLPVLSYQMEGNVTNLGSDPTLNGTLVGTATYNSSIFKRGAQSLLSNTSSYISVPTMALNNYVNGFTIAFWFYRSGVGTETFVYFSGGTGFPMKINSFGNSTTYNMYFSFNGFSSNNYYTFTGINVWNHFAVTLTYSTNTTSTLKVYADGVLRNTTANFTYPTDPYTNNSIGQITGYLDDFRIYNTVLSDSDITNVYNNNYTTVYINGTQTNTSSMPYPSSILRSINNIGVGYLSTDGYSSGYIGDFRIYNAVLSQANVTSLYNQTDTTDNESNLIQHYNFDEDTMNANNDILYNIENTYALKLTNNPTTAGTGQYAIISSGLGNTSTTGLTFSFWWKSKGGYSNQGTWSRIFDIGDNTAGGDNAIIFAVKYGTTESPAIQVYKGLHSGGLNTLINLTTQTNFCDQTWKHVVWTMTYSTTNASTWNVYFDNIRYGGNNLTTTGYYPNDKTRTNAFIGRSYASGDANPNGYIADFRVYTAVLTTQNITDLYKRVYTSTTNLLLQTLTPTTIPPTLNNGAIITPSESQIMPYNHLYLNGSAIQNAQASLSSGLITTNGVSFSFWFKPTGAHGLNSPACFDFGIGESSDNIFFGKVSGQNYPFIRIYLGATVSTNVTLTNAYNFFSNQVWKHVVWTMTYSAGTTSTWNVYINGIQYGGASLTAVGAYPNSIARTSCLIGKSNNVAVDGLLNGQIADFRVYTRVLTQQNATALYNNVYTDNTSLFLQYPTSATDSTFTLQSGATIKPQSLDLNNDGSLNYYIGSHLSLQTLPPIGTNGMSVSFWWRSNSTQANQPSWCQLFSFSNGKSNQDIIYFGLKATNGYPSVNVRNKIKTSKYDFVSGDTGFNTIFDGTWKHIIWTMTYCAPTQSVSTWNLYFNGSLVKTIANMCYPTNVSRKYSYIGRSVYITDPYPNGSFADFRVYRAVLSPANVTSLYGLNNTTDNEQNLLLQNNFNSTESYLYQSCDTIKPSVQFVNNVTTTGSTGQHLILPILPRFISNNYVLTGITISFWWKSNGNNGSGCRIFDFAFAENNDVLVFALNTGTTPLPSIQYWLGAGIDGLVDLTINDGNIEDLQNNLWHHITWTLSYEGNGSASYWKVYMDGNFIKTYNNANAIPVNSTIRFISNYIGRSNWATHGYTNGYISDFRIYDKCLPASDVFNLYTNTFTDNSKLFLRYSFEKKIIIGSDVGTDYFTPSHSIDSTQLCRLYNGATLSTSVYRWGTSSLFLSNTTTTTNLAYTSDGYGQYMHLSTPLQKLAKNGITISFWWKSAGTQPSVSTIFDFAEDTNNRITLYNSNSPRIEVITGAPLTYTYTYSTATNFNDNNWHHVAWTIDKFNNTWGFYYDNVFSGTITSKIYPENVSRAYCYIGRSSAANQSCPNGYIDEFRVHSVSLDATTVQNLYNNNDSSAVDNYLMLHYSFNQDTLITEPENSYVNQEIIDTPLFNV